MHKATHVYRVLLYTVYVPDITNLVLYIETIEFGAVWCDVYSHVHKLYVRIRMYVCTYVL